MASATAYERSPGKPWPRICEHRPGMINMDEAKKERNIAILFWGVLIAALGPWFLIRVQQETNSDILWLCEALQRYFSGLRLSDAAYETNPPLSLLIYALPVLGGSWLHIPLHYAVFAQTCLIVILAALAVLRTLSAWGVFEKSTVSILTAAFILANTLAASLYFGERDHLVGIVLMPFVLMQLTLTYDLPQAKRYRWPVFLLGGVFILLKPHHGLLPSLLLLHRCLRRRDLSVLKDADFLSLAGLTLAYIILTAVAFPDYVTTILPDVLLLYTPLGKWGSVEWGISVIAMLSLVAAGFLTLTKAGKNTIYLGSFMLIAAIISLVPYYVQGMGFYYHLLPAISFFGAAVALTLFSWLRTELPRAMAVSVTLCLMIGLAYIYAPLNIAYPRHGDFAMMPVGKILTQNCPRGKTCTFFMYNKDMGILHETAYDTGIHHASRFPSLWFIPEIVRAQQNLAEGKPSRLNTAQVKEKYDKYSDMIAEDFAIKKPDVVFLWQSRDSYLKTDFVPYLSRNKKFAREWRHYRKDRTITLKYADHYTGVNVKENPLTYDVYRRVSR